MSEFYTVVLFGSFCSIFFFFKQKTAYEMRISDWSSDVCSSDLVATDDRLVDLGTASDVVRLHGQHFLQRVGGAVGFKRPDFHFPEALATELRLTAERLLGDERVRTDRTGMNLVVHEVVQLDHVHVADGNIAFELIKLVRASCREKVCHNC